MQVVQQSDFVTLDTFEKNFPYSLVRLAYLNAHAVCFWFVYYAAHLQ